MDQASFFCPQCRQVKLFQSKPMNHVPHILASVFLCGLWLPIWILIAIGHKPTWHCSFCGFCDAQRYLANPQLRAQEARAAEVAYLVRQETIAARRDSTPFERLSYFISDNRAPMIAIGFGTIVIGTITFAIIRANLQAAELNAIQNEARLAQQNDERNRRTLATAIEEQLKKDHADLRCTTIGNQYTTLWISAKDLNEKFVRDFQKPTTGHLGAIRNAGFKLVVIKNGKQEWSINL